MRKLKFQPLILSICLFAYSFNLTAINIIQFTWSVVGYQQFELRIEHNKQYTIDWGDGSPIETRVGLFGYSNPSHTYANLNEYQVTICSEDCGFEGLDCSNKNISSLDVSKNPLLGLLQCSNNQLTNLDLSNNSTLIYIGCDNNQLTNLDLSNNSILGYITCTNNQLTNLKLSSNDPNSRWLMCSDNRLTKLDLHSGDKYGMLECSNNQLILSQLYAICHNTDLGYKLFGTQNLDASNIAIVDFSSENEFDGVATVFEVQKNNVPAIIGIDYKITNGIISFLESGNYTVTMTNSVICSPAEVKAEFDVIVEGIIPITKSSNIIVYPNPTTNSVYIKTESEEMPELKLYSVDGNLLQNIRSFEINMSNYPAGIYLLKIKDVQKNIYSAKIIKL